MSSIPSFLRPFALDHSPAAASASGGPQKSAILAHNAYFETILSLVPPDVFRRHAEDDEDDERGAAKYKKVSCVA